MCNIYRRFEPGTEYEVCVFEATIIRMKRDNKISMGGMHSYNQEYFEYTPFTEFSHFRYDREEYNNPSHQPEYMYMQISVVQANNNR